MVHIPSASRTFSRTLAIGPQGSDMAGKPSIVVVGGSYVGNAAVEEITALVHKTHNVILVEKNSHFRHLFAFPRIHAVIGFEPKAFVPYTRPGSSSAASFFAAVNGPSSSANEAVEGYEPLPSDSIKIVNDIVTSISSDAVALGDGNKSLPFDFLVLATGTGPKGPRGLLGQDKKHGVEISRLHQENVKKAKRIVIVGGGAYGIQLATDLKTHGPTQSKHVTIVHSRPRLLNRFHEGLHDISADKCKELGIDVILGKRVVVPQDGFPPKTADEPFEIEFVGGGSVHGDLVIQCTGGVPLSSPLKDLAPSAINEYGYIRVKPTLQIDTSISNIFALGDVADTGAHKAARPGRAQAAIVAQNIDKLIRVGLVRWDSQTGRKSWLNTNLMVQVFTSVWVW
ncbi:hypothetical protein D9757_011275 [Collybiopsis confluens]|uniref:FAD/NAD(P)-binding domain-containing protein n=1 Tax=Collybiopsis confluens TaxID=2823264 RepID=A0A8H5GHC0_9AGAR|nr:hypothetical protein D9757_011275 [Collybiopsis confluens]